MTDTTKSEPLEIHADLLSEGAFLHPFASDDVKGAIAKARAEGRPMKVVGFDRATPRVQARLREALGLGPFDEVPQ